MIAFGCCVGYPEKVGAYADPGLVASVPHGRYMKAFFPSNGSDIYPVYACIMRCARDEKVEALVLMHDDLQFRDPELEAKIRLLLSDPSIAVIGLIGSRGAKTLAWWEGERLGRVEDAAFGVHDFGFANGGCADVDTIDGMCVILSPWALENLTLEGLGYEGFHGYADELCYQARAKGKRSVVAQIDAFHHSKGGIVGGDKGWQDANSVFQTRWHSKAEPVGPWAMLQSTADTWDLGAMYDAHRGTPVSETPLVLMITPSYRESFEIYHLTEKSRVAIGTDLEAHGIPMLRAGIFGDSLVQRMRQRAVNVFLKSPATHMLWCDLDIEAIDPTCVRQMLAANFDVVAGACPFKSATRRVVCNLWQDDLDAMTEGKQLALPHGCLEVMDAGTGFMLVTRTALLAMMQAHPELLHYSKNPEDVGEPLWALYDTGVVDGTYQSEDYMFCHYWQQLGGKVYVHVPSTFRHYGTHGFEASLAEQLGLSAT